MTCRLRQLQVYAADRAKAAFDFPASELYLAFDGGSGFEFWLPHISPHSSELPNKAIDKAHTSPLKVMNGHTCGSGCIFSVASSQRESAANPHTCSGLVHGDMRSHVILSPPCIVAGANHTCESILIAINTAYEEHGDLPRRAGRKMFLGMPGLQTHGPSRGHSSCSPGRIRPNRSHIPAPEQCFWSPRKASVQLDNASTNHNMLVFGFCSLYVMFGIFDEFRVRFELASRPSAAHTMHIRTRLFFIFG